MLIASCVLASCGEKKAVSYMAESEVNAEVIQKFFGDLPKVSSTLELKDMKIGMSYREAMKLMNVGPSRCCMGGDSVLFAKYLPETGDIVQFTEEEIPLAADFVPGTGGAPLDISNVPDNASIALKGRIQVFGGSTEFLAVFPQGKLGMMEVKKIDSGKDDPSDTHVVVDSLAKKFSATPKVLRYQEAIIKQNCDAAQNTTGTSAAEREALERVIKDCAETFKFLAGFQDGGEGVLVVTGNRASAPGFGIIRNVETIHLQRKDWLNSQIAIAQKKAGDAQKQQEQATEKRNSDL